MGQKRLVKCLNSMTRLDVSPRDLHKGITYVRVTTRDIQTRKSVFFSGRGEKKPMGLIRVLWLNDIEENCLYIYA